MSVVAARDEHGAVSSGAIAMAAKAVSAAEIVAIPTDTIYGLAADPFRSGAADRLFAVKRRPRHVELPVLVAEPADAIALCELVPPFARTLMETFWPGPLTLVLPRQRALEADLGSDEATIGLRCPDHEVARALCAATGPLATTSANLHGGSTPATAAGVAQLFGAAVAVVLDDGPCEGAASTVVDCTGTEPRLLRAGRVPWSSIATAR